MLKILKSILFILVLFVCSNIYSEELRIFTNVREVEINKTFTLTIEVNENIKNFQLPKMPDFVVILKDSYKKSGDNVYIYELAPKYEGILSIPSITYGQTTTIPISIRVYKKQISNKTNIHHDSNSSVSAIVDSKIVYVNQALSYTLKFRTNRDLKGNPTYILPMFQDFWKNKSKNRSGYKLIDGENYFTFDVTTLLYPIREGSLLIDPSIVSVQYLNSSKDSKFETEKIKVKVLPLPEMGKPDFFSGAVGKYSISAIVNKKNLKINEPLLLTITIKGNGNINSISEPKINLSNDIKKYATTIKTNVDNLISVKQFQCVLIPLIDGEKIIPEISFSYFDPDVKEYREISTKQIKINVSNEKNSENVGSIDDIINEVTQDKDNNNDDMQNEMSIKSNIDTSSRNGILIKNKFFIFIIFVLIVLCICASIYRIKLFFLYKDKVRFQKIKAYKLFMKYFQQTKNALNENRQFKFYYNLNLALKMLLASKNNYNYVTMTKDELKYNLYKLKFEGEIVDDIIDLVIKCDKFKFTTFIVASNEMKKNFSQLNFIKEKLDKIV